jgi:Flp pilus assembly protein TadD
MAGGAVIVAKRGIRRLELAGIGTAVLIMLAGLLAFRGIDTFLGTESSFVQRGEYIAAGVRMALFNPLLGWGSGTSPGALMAFVGEGVRPVTDPHNFLVRLWIELGIPGLVLLGGFLVLLARRSVRALAFDGTRGSSPGYTGYLFGAAAFLLHGLMDMDFFVPETALFGWCAFGALFAAAPVTEEMKPVGERNTVFWRVLGGLTLAAVLPSLVFVQGESLAFRGKKAVESGDFAGAAELYRNASRLLPVSGRFALEEGRARFTTGDPAGALDLYGKADRLMTASPYAPWEIGRAAQAKADWQASLPFLERARSRYPTSPRILIDLARSHLNLGDVASARKVLGEAIRVSDFDPEAGRVARMILDRIGP